MGSYGRGAVVVWASILEIKSGGVLRDKDGVYRCYIPVPSCEPSPAPSLGACGLCSVHSWILQRKDGVSSGILSHRILSLGHTRVHLGVEPLGDASTCSSSLCPLGCPPGRKKHLIAGLAAQLVVVTSGSCSSSK